MTNIDLKRLAVDREYWDSVAPKGATHCGAKHGKAEWWMRKDGLVYERNGALWNERLMWPKNLIHRPAKQEWEDGLPDAYVCPAGCGCMWLDNGDDTMSLYGPNSESCDVCELLPLDALTPVKVLKSPHERQRDELIKLCDDYIKRDDYGHNLADAILSRYNLESKR